MIVDVSVALKWALAEPDSPMADLIGARGDLAAPAALRVEAGYLLTKRVRQRTMTEEQASMAWETLAAASVRYVGVTPLLEPALRLSLRLGASFYDCLYLALAIAEADTLTTADERFVRAVRVAPEFAGQIQTLAEATA